jgi:hypothetical protein
MVIYVQFVSFGTAMYNSPLYFCHACKQYVALDQSKEDCAKEPQCVVDPCPLAHLFTQRSSGYRAANEPKAPGSKQR